MEITKEKIFVSSVRIINPNSAECNHIIGFSELGHYGNLDYYNEPKDEVFSNVIFKFCPLCGKELDKT